MRTATRSHKRHAKKYRTTRKAGRGYGRMRGPKESYTPVKITQANINRERNPSIAAKQATKNATQQLQSAVKANEVTVNALANVKNASNTQLKNMAQQARNAAQQARNAAVKANAAANAINKL